MLRGNYGYYSRKNVQTNIHRFSNRLFSSKPAMNSNLVIFGLLLYRIGKLLNGEPSNSAWRPAKWSIEEGDGSIDENAENCSVSKRVNGEPCWPIGGCVRPNKETDGLIILLDVPPPRTLNISDASRWSTAMPVFLSPINNHMFRFLLLFALRIA